MPLWTMCVSALLHKNITQIDMPTERNQLYDIEIKLRSNLSNYNFVTCGARAPKRKSFEQTVPPTHRDSQYINHMRPCIVYT